MKAPHPWGFSLIEFVLVMMIMSIISVVIARFLIQGYKAFLTSQYNSEVDWQGLIALEELTNDIHTIRSTADINTIQPNQLSFVDVNGNTVQYQLNGSTLFRNGSITANSIQSLNFSYQDKNGAATSTPSAVRYVDIDMTIMSGTISTSLSTLIGTRGMS